MSQPQSGLNPEQQDQLNDAIGAIQSGDRKSGARKLGEILKSNPAAADAWYWMGTALAQDQPQRAIDAFKRANALNPSDSRARDSLATLDGGATATAATIPTAFDGGSTESNSDADFRRRLLGEDDAPPFSDTARTTLSPTFDQQETKPASGLPDFLNEDAPTSRDVAAPTFAAFGEPSPTPFPTFDNQPPTTPFPTYDQPPVSSASNEPSPGIEREQGTRGLSFLLDGQQAVDGTFDNPRLRNLSAEPPAPPPLDGGNSRLEALSRQIEPSLPPNTPPPFEVAPPPFGAQLPNTPPPFGATPQAYTPPPFPTPDQFGAPPFPASAAAPSPYTTDPNAGQQGFTFGTPGQRDERPPMVEPIEKPDPNAPLDFQSMRTALLTPSMAAPPPPQIQPGLIGTPPLPQAVGRGQLPGAGSPRNQPDPSKRRRRNPLIFVLAALILVALVGLIAFLLLQPKSTDAVPDGSATAIAGANVTSGTGTTGASGTAANGTIAPVANTSPGANQSPVVVAASTAPATVAQAATTAPVVVKPTSVPATTAPVGTAAATKPAGTAAPTSTPNPTVQVSGLPRDVSVYINTTTALVNDMALAEDPIWVKVYTPYRNGVLQPGVSFTTKETGRLQNAVQDAYTMRSIIVPVSSSYDLRNLHAIGAEYAAAMTEVDRLFNEWYYDQRNYDKVDQLGVQLDRAFKARNNWVKVYKAGYPFKVSPDLLPPPTTAPVALPVG